MSYAVTADVTSRFGITNVNLWADIDNDQDLVKIAARIAWALAEADGEIDDRLRGGRYLVPIVGYNQTPKTIVALAAMWAGVLLYESRGIQDIDKSTGEPTHRMSYWRKRFEQVMNDVQSGRRKLDAVLSVETEVPEAADDNDEDYDTTGFLID